MASLYSDLADNDALVTCPPLRWGILGCGRVSHDFCQALKLVPSAQIAACAARNVDRAREFATLHSKHDTNSEIRSYGDYESLVADAEVDIVYVGNVHSFRRPVGELCLRAGKHVLLEKPFSCSVEDAKALIQLAAEKKLFLQEGMWTRFFPAVKHARRLVSEQQGQNIGQVCTVTSDFHFNASDSEEYPTSFVYNRRLGGGASFLVGPYPMAAALGFFETTADIIQCVGQVDGGTGVDLQAAVVLQFPPSETNRKSVDASSVAVPGAGMASLSYGILSESEEVTIVVGTKGRLTIQSPCHCPTTLTVQIKEAGRGNVVAQTYEYPLPADTAAITAAGGYVYPNSAGFCYEAAAVARAIAAGLPCCPEYTLDETVQCQRIVEAARTQLKVKGVHDE